MILVVVLALPRTVNGLLIRAQSIVTALEDNVATFPSPSPALAVVKQHTADLSAAETATKTRAMGTVQDRNDTRALLIQDLHQIQAYVQQIVSATPAHAAEIAAMAMMSLRKPRSYQKSDLTVKQIVSGLVRLMGRAVKGAGAYEWQFGVDGKTWSSAPPTMQASTTISGLTRGTLYYFRYRAIVRTGPQNWSPASTLAVS
jgi:hypothetical protein